MQRLLSLGQRRPPFPSGFFTPASSGSSRGVSHHSSTQWTSGSNLRLQSFGDSSRSRPPPSNKSSSGGSGQAGKPAHNNKKNGSPASASKTTAVASTTDENAASAASTAASSTTSAARKARSQRANSRTTAGRKTRIDPFGGEGSLAFNDGSSSTAWLPRSIKPVDILRAHPAQISLDGFYALNRPLLQVTVSPKQRRYPSTEGENASKSKVMEVVGESEFTDAQIQAGQQDPFAEDQIGEYDLHLVTEPDGADPEWAQGTDRYMASLEHNTLPPSPTPSSSSSSTSTASPPAVKRPSKKISQRQEAIDFLFPIQAEARKLEQEESHDSSSSSQDNSLGATIQRLLHTAGYEVDMTDGGAASSQPRNAAHMDPMAGSKFLAGQLMKHKWSGMWEWEPTRRALAAASSPPPPSAATTTPSTKGKGKEDISSSTPSIQTSLDKLGRFSRAQARAQARSAAQTSGTSRNGSGIIRSPRNGEMLTANDGEHLQEMLQKLARDPNSQGKTIFIQVPLDGQKQRSASSKKGKRKANKESSQVVQEDQDLSREIVNEVKAEPLFGEEEVKQVLEQVRKFQGFFDKSVDLDLQNKVATRGSKKDVAQKTDNTVVGDVKHAGLEWDAPSASSSQRQEQEESNLSWFTEERPSEEAVNARFSLLGSRMSNAQAYRGRSLRPTLRERLALRDVELTGPYKWIEMDSVKRKRRKRISKHKYKKRRKATRAERRRLSK